MGPPIVSMIEYLPTGSSSRSSPVAVTATPSSVVVATCSRSGRTSPNSGRTWKRVVPVPPSVILRSVMRPAGVKRLLKVQTVPFSTTMIRTLPPSRSSFALFGVQLTLSSDHVPPSSPGVVSVTV